MCPRAVFLVALFVPLLLIITSSCSSGPPTDLIVQHDHRELARWYEQEAVRLRSKTDDCRQKIQQYEDPLFQPSPKETKQQLLANCNSIIKYYEHSADEADAL